MSGVSDRETIEITDRMIAAALEAYWGKRPYNRHRKAAWSEKECEGMRDAIQAALTIGILDQVKDMQTWPDDVRKRHGIVTDGL